MKIDINKVVPDPNNVRSVKASKEVDDALKASMAALGQLQPILVRDDPADAQGVGPRRYIIVAGERRYRAAVQLGWTEIEAIDHGGSSDQVAAAAAAENMVRSAMNPVDQWRAISALQKGGMSLALAAQSLGIDEAVARRMVLLGDAHPDVLAAIAAHGVPPVNILRIIVQAPHEIQKKAVAAKENWTGVKGNGEPIWWRISNACTLKRLSRDDALFDPDKFDIVWDEDLFAEPDDEDRISTLDVKKFLAAQIVAVKALAAKSKHAVYGEVGKDGVFKAPAGWKVIQTIHFDPKKPIRNPGPGLKVMLSVVMDGHRLGDPWAMIIAEVGAKKKGTKDQGAPGGTTVGDDEPVAAPKPPIDKKGLVLLAEIKRAFFVEAFGSDEIKILSDANVIRMLLIALAASNVRIIQGDVSWRTAFMEDIAARALAWPAKSGALAWPAESGLLDDLKVMAAEALTRMIQVPDGKGTGSGPALGWIGSQIFHVPTPRFDTEEFLAHVNTDVLRLLAEGRDFVPAKTGAKLRAQLVGKLEGWKPPGWFDDRAPALPDPVGEDEADEEAPGFRETLSEEQAEDREAAE